MATLQAQSAHQGSYGGTHGNMACVPFVLTGGAAANDIVVLGKLPMGLMIKRVGAGLGVAAAGVTVDIKMIKEDGTSVTLITGLDVNAKLTAKDLVPVYTDFDTGKAEIQAVVKGGAVPDSASLHVYLEYVTIGTE